MLISQWVTLARMASDLGHLKPFFGRGVYNFYETMPMGRLLQTWILSIMHWKAHCFCCLLPAMRLLGDIYIFAGATQTMQLINWFKWQQNILNKHSHLLEGFIFKITDVWKTCFLPVITILKLIQVIKN